MYNNILKEFIENNKNRDVFSIIKDLWVEIEYINYIETNWCCIDIFWKNYILINKNLNKEWVNFTIWHEICHFLLWEKWFSININFAKKDFIEKRADNFAVDLLIDSKELKEQIEVYWADIFQLEKIFLLPAEKILLKIKRLYPNYY